MKKFLLFVLIISFYCFCTFLDRTYIQTDSKIIDFLAKDYPSEVVQNYIETQKMVVDQLFGNTFINRNKNIIGCFCLNFIKLFDLPGLEKVQYFDFVWLTLIAELIFILSGFISL